MKMDNEGTYCQIIQFMLVRAPHGVVQVVSLSNKSQGLVGVVGAVTD